MYLNRIKRIITTGMAFAMMAFIFCGCGKKTDLELSSYRDSMNEFYNNLEYPL